MSLSDHGPAYGHIEVAVLNSFVLQPVVVVLVVAVVFFSEDELAPVSEGMSVTVDIAGDPTVEKVGLDKTRPAPVVDRRDEDRLTHRCVEWSYVDVAGHS